MADMLCALADDLVCLRPFAVIGELPIIDQQAQVLLFVSLILECG